MKISEVVQRKGSNVVTILPDATVTELLASLHEHHIGALVVSTNGTTVEGIVSERDVVRALHERGVGVLDEPVRSIMTVEVQTCQESDDLRELAVRMTEHRVRHLPVVDDEHHLMAIVSIGDVVKRRLDELEDETSQLFHYVQGDRSTV